MPNEPKTRYGETWDYTAQDNNHYVQLFGEHKTDDGTVGMVRGKCRSGQPFAGDMILLNNGKTRIRLAEVTYPEGQGYTIGRVFEAQYLVMEKPKGDAA